MNQISVLSYKFEILQWIFRVSFSSLPNGGKMRLYELLRGQVCIRVQSMWQTRGAGGMLPREILILDLLLDAIWWNLGTVFAQT